MEHWAKRFISSPYKWCFSGTVVYSLWHCLVDSFLSHQLFKSKHYQHLVECNYMLQTFPKKDSVQEFLEHSPPHFCWLRISYYLMSNISYKLLTIMRKFVGFQIILFFLASRLKNISYSSYSQRKVVKAIDFMTPPRLPHTHTNTHTSAF